MEPVAFDHKAHEKYNNDCRVCHHKGMEACEKCHTLGGSKDGGMVTLEQAMHSLSSRIAAWAATPPSRPAKLRRLPQPYQQVKQARRRQLQAVPPAGQLTGWRDAAREPGKIVQATEGQLAETMLKSRNMNPGTYALDDIPEKVAIKELANRYKPAEFKHREHVLALMKGMKGNELAGYFHSDPGTICQGCHHNSPPAKNPPACASCHKNDRGTGEVRPGGEPSGAAGGPARPVHGLPQGHEGEAGGHVLHRVSPGKEEVTGPGLI